MLTIRQKIVNELKIKVKSIGELLEWGYSQEGAYNKSISSSIYMYLQVATKHFFSSCIDICFQVVLTFVFKLLQVGTRCLVFTSCYNVLQVHVSTHSEMT